MCSGYDDSHLGDVNNGDGINDSRRDMFRAANLAANDAMVEGSKACVLRVFVLADADENRGSTDRSLSTTCAAHPKTTKQTLGRLVA